MDLRIITWILLITLTQLCNCHPKRGVSRVLRESMAFGKPILSFRLEGTLDLLCDNEDCLLSDLNDIINITSKS